MKFISAGFTTLTLVMALSALSLSAPPPPALVGFRKWQRVTKEPYRQVRLVSLACMAPIPPMAKLNTAGKLTFTNPHLEHDVHVFVNPVGKDSMKLDGPKFPVGSVVVKEKYEFGPQETLQSRAVLLTVMRKRESGYDTANGDWEYFTGDPKTLRLKKVTGPVLKTCQSCHAHYSKHDFITKTYLQEKPVEPVINVSY